MTRRKEKWCVPGYQASQRGRFSSSVALTPQFIARARGHKIKNPAESAGFSDTLNFYPGF